MFMGDNSLDNVGPSDDFSSGGSRDMGVGPTFLVFCRLLRNHRRSGINILVFSLHLRCIGNIPTVKAFALTATCRI